MKTHRYDRARQPAISATSAALVLAMVSACGGDNSTSIEAANASIPPTVSSDEIIRDVAVQIGGNVGTNIDGMASVVGQSSAVSSLMDNTASNSNDELAVSRRNMLSSNNDESETALTRLLNDDPQTTSEENVEQLILPTLGVGGNGSVTRNGSTLTIDPDENYICLQWMGSGYDSDCPEFFSHLTVQIDAWTENRGTVSYQFARENVLTVAYAPNEGSYEFSLAGFIKVLEHLANTDPDLSVPDTMSGAIKLSASVVNDKPGTEAGTFSVAVTQPLSIVDSSENLDLQIQKSTLLAMSSDAATGTGEIAIEVLGLVINGLTENTDGSNSTVAVNLPALSMNAVLQSGGDSLTLSQTGLGSEPFTIDVDDINVMQISLPFFSAMLNHSGGVDSVSFLQGFDLGVAISDMSVFDEAAASDSSALLSVEVPGATTLQELASGSIRVDSGGPVEVAYTLNDGVSNPSATVVVGAGECFSNDESSDDPIVRVACE